MQDRIAVDSRHQRQHSDDHDYAEPIGREHRSQAHVPSHVLQRGDGQAERRKPAEHLHDGAVERVEAERGGIDHAEDEQQDRHLRGL